jgi:metal-sulfur cluster biosynthetic enzyme
MRSVRRLSSRLVMTVALVGIGILVIGLPVLLRHRTTNAISLASVTTFVDSGPGLHGIAAPDSAAVARALDRVMDPELGLSVVELGLVHAQHVDSLGNVSVVLALPTSECPLGPQLAQSSLRELKAVQGVRRIQVRLDPSLPWDPSNLSEPARQKFRQLFGDDGGSGR